MAHKRWNRDEFFDRLAGMDEAQLKKTLWTLYWRGAAAQRERIEGLLDPTLAEATKRKAQEVPEAGQVLAEVNEFATLARAGAYMAGDRRVSPRERTRWRLTFRHLAHDAISSLKDDDVNSAESAASTMVDLACQMWDHDFFRSEDPVEAARFVVSDAVKAMWLRRRQQDPAEFVGRAPAQLLRWESQSGWTRYGAGWTAERETTLAEVAGELLTTPDMWHQFAVNYVDAYSRPGARDRRGPGGIRFGPSGGMGHWHTMLRERLAGSDDDHLLDGLP